MRKIRLGELFCGPGGIAKGAHKAASRIKEIELSHAWAVDSDPDTCETYIRNIKGSNYDTVFCEDIRKLEFKNLFNASSLKASQALSSSLKLSILLILINSSGNLLHLILNISGKFEELKNPFFQKELLLLKL